MEKKRQLGEMAYSFTLSAAAAKSPQSCPTLCDPMDGSPPGSSIHGIFQARALEWGAIAFSNAGVLFIYSEGRGSWLTKQKKGKTHKHRTCAH